MSQIPPESRKEFGQTLNTLKDTAQQKYDQHKAQVEQEADKSRAANIDMTMPVEDGTFGSLHPVSIVMNRVVDIFTKIGFTVAEEREIEDDWYNFTAMNTPEDHPARDMQDTFYLKDKPSAEVDVYWGLETELDHKITKGTGWLEILGCGMVDPQVLTNCGIDPEKYTGFAF
ncbi:unnamed protein product, partial [Cyprideis torosa]